MRSIPRIEILAQIVALATFFSCCDVARGDPSEAPNDFAILLTTISEGIPRNAAEASRTFDWRASRILPFAACFSEPALAASDPSYRGVFNSRFSDTLEAWGRDALAKLAYQGDCPNSILPNGTGGNAAQRYHAVDVALSQLQIDLGLQLGTDDHDSVAGIKINRRGDLDTGFKEFIPILYLYQDRIPLSYSHLRDTLARYVAGARPRLDTPPTWHQQLNIGGIDAGLADIPETENHSLLELSEQYLINQLVNRDGSARWDNSQVHDRLMGMLKGILTSDFHEYNAKPYQHFSLYAVENLTDFAGDDDVAAAAKMVLDFAAAKFAVSSNLLRRNSPYRRRGSHEGHLFTGTYADEQVCRFYLYTGQVQALFSQEGYAASWGCISAVREIIGTYRPPYAIVDRAINSGTPYLQTFNGDLNYYANLFGSSIGGAVEVYDNERSFLIAAGGVPNGSGLPLRLNGLSATARDALVQLGFLNANDTVFSPSDEDVGISLATVLIPYDVPRAPSDVGVVHPVVDRAQLVRIDGTGHKDFNLCVARSFACGKNPVMPGQPAIDGWQFTTLPSVPKRTFVAMLSMTTQDGYRVGLFEAQPEDGFLDFADFQAKVRANNPHGTAIFQQEQTHNCNFKSWTGEYKRADGAILKFTIRPDENACKAAGYHQYPITSPNTALPDPNIARWKLASGPMDADKSGVITIVGSLNGSRCHLNITDIHHPQRSCFDDPHYDGPRVGAPFIQSDWGERGNFELLVPTGSVIRQYFRNNDDPQFAWHYLREFGYPVPATQLGPTPSAVSFLQSNFRGDGVHGNFEVVVRVRAPIATEPQHLDFWYLDSKTSQWHGPSHIAPDGQLIAASGNPALLQSDWGSRGNFELLVPSGSVIKQYFRDNDDPQFAWHYLRDFGYPVPPNQLGPTPRAVSFIQSNFKGDGVHGNFEAVVRVKPAIATEADHLDFWYLDSKTSQWHGPGRIIADGQPITATGDPVLIQSNWGKRGNFELLVPSGSVVKQYYRNNDDPQFAWHFLREFGYPVPATELGRTPAALTFLQSNFAADGTHGNFESIVQVKPPIATASDQLDFWLLDSQSSTWHPPAPIVADGQPIQKMNGL